MGLRGEQQLWPVERSAHAACCLGFGNEHPQLLISGGVNDFKTLKDYWLFDMSSRSWKEVEIRCLELCIYILMLLLYQHACLISAASADSLG